MLNITENIPLAPLTTFHVGGPARYFARAASIDDLESAAAFVREKGLPLFVLGGGSNVLIPDEGFDGLVLKMEIGGMEICSGGTDCRHRVSRPVSDTRCLQSPNFVLLIAGAGESWDAVVARAAQDNLWGIENLSAIPGTVGGAVVQNIGAYGAALSEVLAWVDVWHTRTGEMKRFTNAECAFEYRDSAFKHDPDLIVVRAALRLSREPKPNLSYRDLNTRFKGQTPSLAEIRQAVTEIRAGKFPDLSHEGSAGSFFKNPMLPKVQARALQEQYPTMPLFDMPETANVKVPLAWLLDKVLHLNGYRVGSARLYEKQPIVIATDRGAPSADVIALAAMVRKQVRETFGLDIEEEVRIIA